MRTEMTTDLGTDWSKTVNNLRHQWHPKVLVTTLGGGKVRATREIVKRLHPGRKAACPRAAARLRWLDDYRNGFTSQRR